MSLSSANSIIDVINWFRMHTNVIVGINAQIYRHKYQTTFKCLSTGVRIASTPGRQSSKSACGVGTQIVVERLLRYRLTFQPLLVNYFHSHKWPKTRLNKISQFHFVKCCKKFKIKLKMKNWKKCQVKILLKWINLNGNTLASASCWQTKKVWNTV